MGITVLRLVARFTNTRWPPLWRSSSKPNARNARMTSLALRPGNRFMRTLYCYFNSSLEGPELARQFARFVEQAFQVYYRGFLYVALGFLKGFTLRVAPRQGRNGCYVPPVGIGFVNDGKGQWSRFFGDTFFHTTSIPEPQWVGQFYLVALYSAAISAAERARE